VPPRAIAPHFRFLGGSGLIASLWMLFRGNVVSRFIAFGILPVQIH
jgi:hypothetical protein